MHLHELRAAIISQQLNQVGDDGMREPKGRSGEGVGNRGIQRVVVAAEEACFLWMQVVDSHKVLP